jgi:monofunctional biosynthetic peptidoglycan transglycosylase
VGILWTGLELLRLPDVESLAQENPKTTSFIERFRSRQPKGSRVRWTWVSYERISPHLKRAVLVEEDINFFSHDGFDFEELRKALEEAWTDRTFPRGASTITQQLAKNLWLSPSRDPIRKIKEALLARQLERHLTKKRILEIYLNIVAFGPGLFGAEEASRHYFGKPASALDPNEAAQLAAGLPRPSKWHPGATSKAYQRHVGKVLARMEKAQFLWRLI